MARVPPTPLSPTEYEKAEVEVHNALTLEIVQDILRAGLAKGEFDKSVLITESTIVGVIGAIVRSEKGMSQQQKINYARILLEELCSESFVRISCWIERRKYEPK